MSDVKIKVLDGGPYQVTGKVVVENIKGEKLGESGERDLWLCRCGKSGNKPFCDGSHKKSGFDG